MSSGKIVLKVFEKAMDFLKRMRQVSDWPQFFKEPSSLVGSPRLVSCCFKLGVRKDLNRDSSLEKLNRPGIEPRSRLSASKISSMNSLKQISNKHQ